MNSPPDAVDVEERTRIARTKVEHLRSPYEKVAGLYHLGRMLDKIRLHQAGTLPQDYHRNLGLSAGLDGHLCGFLGVEFSAIGDRVRQGGSDDEIAEWCFEHGLRPAKMQTRIWNEFARKFGYDDLAEKFLARVKSEDGLADRTDVVTAFDLIDLQEGRSTTPKKTAPGKLEQIQALLAGENRLLKMVASGWPLAETLTSLCRLIEEHSKSSLCGILLVDRAKNRVDYCTGPSLPAEYNEAIRGVIVTAEAGPCGTAICTKNQVIAVDVAADTRWVDEWRTLALSHGLCACWSTPIFSSEGSVLGTFAIYWREPRSPTEQDQKLIAQVTDLAAVAIERRRIEEKLRQNESSLTEAIDTIPGLVWSVRPDGEVDFLNYRWREYTGLTLDQARGWGWRAAIHRDDLPGLESYWRSVITSGEPGEIEARLRRHDGTFRWFLFRAVPLRDDAGKLVKWYGQNTDIDDRKCAEEALRASEHLARGQVEALTSTLAALARESDPDRLLEHVLRTIVEQTKAHSVAAWIRNEDGESIDLVAVIEAGRFQKRENATEPTARISMRVQSHPVWREVLRTAQHGVMEDIDQESARMCVGSGADAVWHRVPEDIRPDPGMALLMNHLREMDVRVVLFVPLLSAGKTAGIIAVRFQEKRIFHREEIELSRALAHQAMLAIELMRLSQQSRQSAVIGERNRLAREIHDTLAQGFTGIIMQLEAARGATVQGDMAEAVNRIERAGELARSSLGEARRSVRALRPRSLRSGHLFVALDDLLKRTTEGTDLNAEFHADGDERSIPADVEEGLLRITQEALTNVVKHASARNFRATLSVAASEIQLRLVDDGCGFDARQEHDGFGLTGMKERVDRMSGQFIIRSKSGVGTELLIELKNLPPPKPENLNGQS